MTRTDKWLIGIILVLALVSLLALQLMPFGEDPITATVKVQGRIVDTRELSEKGDSKTLEVKGPLGISVIQVEGEQIRMLSSPCPDKLCVKQDWIAKPGEVVVCVPNEISVSLEGDDGLDAIIR